MATKKVKITGKKIKGFVKTQDQLVLLLDDGTELVINASYDSDDGENYLTVNVREVVPRTEYKTTPVDLL